MSTAPAALSIALVALAAGACDQKSDKTDASASAPKPSATVATTATASASAATTASAAAPAESAKPAAPSADYAMTGIRPIADDCKDAFVVAAQAPATADPDEWTWILQAVLANPQFKPTSADTPASGQVTFRLFQASEKFQKALVLVARCGDGATCNKLSAMLRAVTKTKSAQVVCGNLPLELSWSSPVKPELNDLLAEPARALPLGPGGRCVRLQACAMAADPAKADSVNLAVACIADPSKYKIACASKPSCAEVVSCANEK